MIDLLLFENDYEPAKVAIRYGVSTFLLDWEVMDKETRQLGFDTEIRPGTLADLERLVSIPGATLWCRLNRYGLHTKEEVDVAVAAGAHGLFLPMVSAVDEVARFLAAVNGRARTGILVETASAFQEADKLAKLPVDCVYFGLNDFAISRGGGSIFDAVLDGSVLAMRTAFVDKYFGFGGMTAMDAGNPVPARLLLAEMARLNCSFTFLRRSFRKDIRTRDPGSVVAGIRSGWTECRARNLAAILRDRQELEARLRDVCLR
jgi:hypothetical protein